MSGSPNTALQLSGAKKAAILMVILGEERCAPVIRCLNEQEIQRVSREVARVSSLVAQEGEAVLEEFQQMLSAREYMRSGGMEYARKMLLSAFGPEQGQRLMEQLMKSIDAENANFDALQRADPQQLAKFIHSEHPQTIALVLAHLNPAQAASLLFSLPPELRGDVAQRMANLDQISPDIIARIAAVIGQKLKALGQVSRETYGGVRAVAEMFNHLDTNSSKEVLEAMESSSPNLVESIRHLMFVFEDLLQLDATAVKEVLTRVDRKNLTIALKGTSDKLKDHFIKEMSQRGGEMLREDMDALGPVRIRDVETAQQQMISLVRQMEAEGVISLKGAGNDQYVV